MRKLACCFSFAILFLGVTGPAASGEDEAQPDEARFTSERNLVYGRAGEVDLKLDAFVPRGEGPHPGVLVVHGGAWRSGSKTQLRFYALHLAKRGYAAFAINYRLAPKHRFPAQIDDCRTAVRWLVENAGRFRLDAKRLGALGYSAGGHLVTMLGVQGVELTAGQAGDGTTSPFRLTAVVAGGAPCDFRNVRPQSRGLSFWLGGTRSQKPDVYRNASPAAFVTSKASPFFFYHGETDLIVGVDNPRRMTEALEKAGVEAKLHVIPSAGHILAVFNPDTIGRFSKFFDKHLKK